MDFQGLLGDYAQLFDPKQNEKLAGTQSLGQGLLKQVGDHLPSNEQMADPSKMVDYAAGMNPVMGLMTKFVNEVHPDHLIDTNVLYNWLQNQKVPTHIAKAAIDLHQKLIQHDMPGTKIFDPTGNLKGPQFQSDDMAAHTLRVLHGTTEMAKSLDLPDNEISRIVSATSTHDAGKSTVPLHVMWRTLENRAGENFPMDFSKLPSQADLAKYPDGPYKTLMDSFYKYNTNDMATTAKFSNFTKKDQKIMEAHNAMSIPAGNAVGMPQGLSKEGMYHHQFYDGTEGYPARHLPLSKEDIPMSGRIASIVDAFDAIVSPRYGGRTPAWEDTIMPDGFKNPGALSRLLSLPRKYGLDENGDALKSAGTQFDPKLLDHFVSSGLAEQYYKMMANKMGPDLQKFFVGK